MFSRRIIGSARQQHALWRRCTSRYVADGGRKQRPARVPACLFTSQARVGSLSSVLQTEIERGTLRPDDAQAVAARRLSRLQDALVGYTNKPLLQWIENKEERERRQKEMKEPESIEFQEDETDVTNNSTKTSLEAQSNDDPPTIRVPRGLFLHGHVGTGKSMLMDLFFAQAQVENKRRVHFHSFLQDVHVRIHALKQSDLKNRGRDFHVDTSSTRNPIVRVAKHLASEVSLLCFDEFQVTDVADALIMKQLFEVLFQHGTVMVATSNRPPTDLYEGGLNRSYFLPFIDLLHKHCMVHEIQSETDYRRLLSENMKDCFIVDSGDFTASEQVIDSIFRGLLQGSTPISMELQVTFNRSISVPQAHPDGVRVARFQFHDLCNRELGSSDYRAIAKQFSVVIVERIPILTLKEHDQARRFITLVDELYEGRCALICSAVADPEHLFVDRHVPTKPDPDSIETKVGEMFGIDVAQSTGRTVGELASVRELSFAFRRAASRLTEMCSRNWWEKATEETAA